MIKKNQQGIILPTLIILMTAFSIIGMALASYTTAQFSRSKNNVFVANAMQVAEAGIEQSLSKINENESFSGYPTEQVFFDNAIQGKGVFTTTITTTAGSNAKVLVSTGKVYRQSKPAEPVSTRKVKVTIVGTNSQGYSVYTGPGGLIVQGGANLTNTDVYVNGTISMDGGSNIGTYNQPLDIDVANYACPKANPPGPTYPQLCPAGNQAITFGNGNFIYGSVCATNQTISKNPNQGNQNIQGGVSGVGLKPNCVAPQVQTPTHDRAAQISAITTTGSSSSNMYAACSYPFQRTWPAKLKITGNVVIDNCKVLIKGDTYITGDFSLTGGAVMTVDDSVGTNRPVIMVDGKVNINSPGGGGSVLPNKFGTGAHFISYKTNAACNPNCTTLTGNELKNSQSLETVTVGGGTKFPGMVFQSYWGKIKVTAGGNIGSAIGQTVDLSGGATITFGTILSSGTRSWTVTSYQQVFN